MRNWKTRSCLLQTTWLLVQVRVQFPTRWLTVIAMNDVTCLKSYFIPDLAIATMYTPKCLHLHVDVCHCANMCLVCVKCCTTAGILSGLPTVCISSTCGLWSVTTCPTCLWRVWGVSNYSVSVYSSPLQIPVLEKMEKVCVGWSWVEGGGGLGECGGRAPTLPVPLPVPHPLW